MPPARRIVYLALAVLVLIVLLAAGGPNSQETQLVFVTNFPDTQHVRGEVKIEGPVRLAELAAFKGVLVPPVRPTETTRLVVGGTLKADGFSAVVLSLAGQVKGNLVREGTVGAILVPDEEEIQVTFEEQGLVQFPLEVRAPLPASASYFSSDQPRHTIAFPAYRVLLYNTTDKTVDVDLYAYLTN